MWAVELLYLAVLIWTSFYFGVVKLSSYIRRERIKETNVWMIICCTICFHGVAIMIYRTTWPLIEGLF